MSDNFSVQDKKWPAREEEINKVIIQYCKNYFYPYALLLDGSWGSGKSYFIRNKVINCWPKDMKVTPIYISLYGLRTVADFWDKVYISVFEKKTGGYAGRYVGRNIGRNIGRYLINTLRAGKIIVVDEILPKIGWGISEKSMKKVQEVFGDVICHMEKYCFILDDFERCMISMNEILGEISRMLEEHQAKVLIVANESEIGFHNIQQNVEMKTIAAALACQQANEAGSKAKNGEDSTEDVKNNIKEFREGLFGAENSLYKKTKEKIIGQTLYYNSTIAEKIESVLENMTQKKTQEGEAFPQDFLEWIIKKQDLMVRLMEYLKCRNLRTLEFAVSRFMELEQYIQWPLCDKKHVNTLREYILYSTFHISVQLRERSEQRRNWEANKVYVFHTMYHETTIFDEFSSYVILKFVEDYIYDGCADQENINKGVERVAALIISRDRKKNDPLNTLLQYLNLEDHDVISLLAEIKRNLKKGDYGLGDYQSILGLCQELSNIGYKEANIASWAPLIEENLEKGNVSEDAVGAVFMIRDQDDPPYKECLEEIEDYEFMQSTRPFEEQITDTLNNNLPVNTLISLIREDAPGFFSHGLFIKLPVKNLAEYLIRRPNREIHQFYEVIRYQYHLQNIKDFCQRDVEPLIQFIEILEGKEQVISDKMKLYNMRLLCGLAREVCDKMK
ncbi:MAG: P-loop NTPase fold protein [Selenomonas noxia]